MRDFHAWYLSERSRFGSPSDSHSDSFPSVRFRLGCVTSGGFSPHSSSSSSSSYAGFRSGGGSFGGCGPFFFHVHFFAGGGSFGGCGPSSSSSGLSGSMSTSCCPGCLFFLWSSALPLASVFGFHLFPDWSAFPVAFRHASCLLAPFFRVLQVKSTTTSSGNGTPLASYARCSSIAFWNLSM